jgi:hypothetical protein
MITFAIVALLAFVGSFLPYPWSDWCFNATAYILLAGVIIRFVRRPAAGGPVESASETNAFRFLGWAAGIFGVLALVSNRAILASAGIPVAKHDWVWPIDQRSLQQLYTQRVSAWDTAAFGSPKAFPTIYPIDFVSSMLAHVFTAKHVLDIFVIALPVIAGLGVCAAIRFSFGGSQIGAIVAGALYAFSPFTLEEFVAGHIPNLLAYALFPYLIITYARAVRSRAPMKYAGFIAFIVAFSAGQLQYIAFDIFACAALWAIYPRRKTMLWFLAVGVAVGLLPHVQSIAHLFATSSQYGASTGDTQEWYRDLSVPLRSVYGLGGYIAQYSDYLYPAAFLGLLRGTLAVLTVTIVAYALFVRRTRASLVAGVLFCIGIFCASGVFEPGSFIKVPLVEHVTAMGLFREFFNFEVFVEAALAIAIGDVLISLTLPSPALAAASIFVLAIAAYPALSGNSVLLLNMWQPGAIYQQLAQLLAAPDGSRVATLPLIGPMRDGEHRAAGNDPLMNGVEGHPITYEWRPGPITSTAQMLLVAGRPHDAMTLLGVFGARYVLLRHDWFSVLPWFYFIKLFPYDWTFGIYEQSVVHASQLHRIASGDAADIFLDGSYVPIVTLTRPGMIECDPNEFYKTLIAGTCPRTKHATAFPGTSAVRFHPAVASSAYMNPQLGWVSTSGDFYFGIAAAALTRAGVTTKVPAALDQSFTAASGSHVFVKCVSSLGMTAVFKGKRTVRLCRDRGLTELRWVALPGTTQQGVNTVELDNVAGTTIVASIATGPSLDAVRVAELAPFVIPQKNAQVRFSRLSGTQLAGEFDAQPNAWLLFSDTFDPRWTLHVDGAAIRSVRVNDFENGFPVQAGSHRFILAFETSTLDRVLGWIEKLAWIPILLSLAVLPALLGDRGRTSVTAGQPVVVPAATSRRDPTA